MTNAEKVIRSLNSSMRDWTTDIFNGMSEYDKNTGLTRRQWSDGIQTNIRAGRISNYPENEILDTSKRLDYGMFRLIRKERYINIAKDCSNLEIGDDVIKHSTKNYCAIIRNINFKIWNHRNYYKIISENEYQSMEKTAEKLNDELPNYVTKANDRSVLPNKFKINAGEYTEDIQKILFKLGIKWPFSVGTVVQLKKTALLFIADGNITAMLNSKAYYKSKQYPELTVTEFYELVGLEEPASTKDSKSEGQYVEPKVDDYVRLKKEIHILFAGRNILKWRRNLDYIREQIVKVNAIYPPTIKYLGSVNEKTFEGSISGIDDNWIFPYSSIKKKIKLPEKFKIDCGDETKKVQKILGDLGCCWSSDFVPAIYGYEYLVINCKTITYEEERSVFTDNKHPELTVTEFYEHVGLDVPKNKPIKRKQPINVKEASEALKATITTIQKPPLEIKPRWMWLEDRFEKLNEILKYYIETNRLIPTGLEWIEERNGILEELKVFPKYEDK